MVQLRLLCLASSLPALPKNGQPFFAPPRRNPVSVGTFCLIPRLPSPPSFGRTGQAAFVHRLGITSPLTLAKDHGSGELSLCGRNRLSRRSITTEAMGLNTPLASYDPEVQKLIDLEKERQKDSLCLIASENFASRAVMEAVGSAFMNKYSEGYPGARYYGGNEHIDKMEMLCQQRALEAFQLDPEKWGVNVQALSGSPANFAVYTALLSPHDRIMGLDLPDGGHLSHGYQSPTRKVSSVSVYFECMPYKLDKRTGYIDYDELEVLATRFRPKILIAGATAYSRALDYKRMKDIADAAGSYVLADMAHIAGLVAAGQLESPFTYADVVTCTTHKSLRGPRGALIFYRKGQRGVTKSGKAIEYDLEDRINKAVFPGLQGGPHDHTIAGIAVALKYAKTPEFTKYQEQVKKNAAALGEELVKLGFDLVSGGTDNHMVVVDLKLKGISGAKCEKICEFVNICLNKNTVPSDRSAMNPNGIRIGSPAMTSRGLVEEDFRQIARFISDAVDLGLDIQKSSGPKVADFVEFIKNANPTTVAQLRKDVQDFSSQFPTVGL